jgi:hypothetical protein
LFFGIADRKILFGLSLMAKLALGTRQTLNY